MPAISWELILLFLGWMFALSLSHSEHRRSESLRRKEKLIELSSSLNDWLDNQLQRDSFSSPRIEEYIAGKVTQIEFKINQLNSHIGKQVFTRDCLADIRDIDVTCCRLIDGELVNSDELIVQLRNAVFNFIEGVEAQYSQHFFSNKGLAGQLRYYIPEMSGFLVAILCLVGFLVFIKVVSSTFF